MPQFFLSCNLGLEEVLKRELQEVFPYLLGKDGRPQAAGYQLIAEEKGGLEIETSLEAGLQLNFFLKTCGRILLRLGKEKIVEFYHLEAWLRKMKPKQILGETEYEFEIAASHSRLGHEKRLAQTMEQAFGPSKQGAPRLFLRMFEDKAQLSLDTSGEHLHFRGYRLEQGAAPLRETLAASMVLQLCSGHALSQIEKVSLFDPFCGSGTLLIEAQRLYKAELDRSFAFQSWKNLSSLFKSKDLAGNFRGYSAIKWKSLIGQDSDLSVLEKAKANSVRAQCANEIQWLQGDSVKEAKDNQSADSNPLWIISNPPYGERLQSKASQGADQVRKILEIYRPDRAGFLVPDSWNIECPGYQSRAQLSFKNGGLPVHFLVFERSMVGKAV